MSNSNFINATPLSGAFTAAEDIDAFEAVTLGASGVSVADAATAPMYLVSEDYTSGDTTVTLYKAGTGRARVDGSGTAIAVGDALTATTGGTLIKTTTSGNYVIGYALQAATAANDVIYIDIERGLVP